MRTLTAAETALLTAPSGGYATWTKVEIDRDNAGTWVNMSTLLGIDWVIGCTYGESIDTPAWTASVTLMLTAFDNPELSLSPFISASLCNSGGVIIQPYRRIRISTAIVPVGSPAPSTYNLVFKGRIDSYELGHDSITIQCRDQTGDLQDCFIKKVRSYGSDTPGSATGENQLQSLIQDLIDHNYNTRSDIVTSYSGAASAPANTTLSSRDTGSGGTIGVPYHLHSATGTSSNNWAAADDTNWSLRRWGAAKAGLWQTIQQLADMIGYTLRFRWHDGSGISSIVLVLEDPDRSTTTAHMTIDVTAGGPATIRGVNGDIADVRNYWRVGYAKDGAVNKSVTSAGAVSITKYGERYAEVQEGAQSQIDTSTEAQAMADGFLSDTEEPVAVVQVETNYMYHVQLNDRIKLTADGRFFDTDQTLVCVARTNTISQGGPARSELTLTGTVQTSGRVRHVALQRVFDSVRSSPVLVQSTAESGLLVNGTFGTRTEE